MNKPYPVGDICQAHGLYRATCNSENAKRHHLTGPAMVKPVTLELGPLNVWKPLSTEQASDRTDEACMLRGGRAYGLWISRLGLHLRSLWLAGTSKRLGTAAILPA